MFSKHLRFAEKYTDDGEELRGEDLSLPRLPFQKAPRLGWGPGCLSRKSLLSPAEPRVNRGKEMLGAGLCLGTEVQNVGRRNASLTPSLIYPGSVFDLG